MWRRRAADGGLKSESAAAPGNMRAAASLEQRGFRWGYFRYVMFACAATAHIALAAADCEPPRADIARAATTLVTKPAIAWTPVQGATSYRVRIQSRIPNGRVLAQHDVVVNEPRFFPPQPLADHRAKVTVRLAAICGKEASAESVSWFVIDASAACSGEGRVENRAYALTDGRLITKQESRTIPHVQSARPLCAGARGEAAYRVTAGD
jgi:hypothetical protein